MEEIDLDQLKMKIKDLIEDKCFGARNCQGLCNIYIVVFLLDYSADQAHHLRSTIRISINNLNSLR